MARAANTTKRKIPLVQLQPREEAVDALVDGLAMLWNEQISDDQAYTYFHEALPADRGNMLARSLYRYPDRDRAFLARLLLDLARAVSIGLFRYMP